MRGRPPPPCFPVAPVTVGHKISDPDGVIIREKQALVSGAAEQVPASRAALASEIATQIGQDLLGQLKAPVLRLGGNYSAVPFFKPLETAFVPGQAPVEAALRQVLR